MKVVLFVNSDCNANCKHCYIPYSGSRSPENTLRLVHEFQNQGYEVDIAGSEVLLDPGYLKAYKQAGQKRILTNGIALDKNKKLYDLIRANGITTLVFSMHFGIEKDLRSIPEKLMARVIAESKSRGFIIKVLTVITSKNYMNLEDMCEKVIAHGVDVFYPLRFVGCKPKPLGLTSEQLRIFFAQVKGVRKKYSKSTLDIKLHGNFGPRPGSEKSEQASVENKYCPAGQDLLIIDPHNNVYGCPFLMQPENKIGLLQNDKIVLDKELLCEKRSTCIAHKITKS